jgi:hypothetical protein
MHITRGRDRRLLSICEDIDIDEGGLFSCKVVADDIY